MQADGDNAHETLAKLYGDPTHFITELLQNAEDEGAKNVYFTLTESELIFTHDAPKLFDFNDIRAISNFGDNYEKKEKPNAIGRFGIGFKSVYSITNSPRIISAEYDITIKNYNIPEKTYSEVNSYYKGTKIVLPFKEEKRNEIYRIIYNELQDLNMLYLLFLTNITSISWETDNDFGIYERVYHNEDNRIVRINSVSKQFNFILLERSVNIEKKDLLVKIAFQIDKNDKVIVPCDKSPLFVFFPTKIETNLKFLIHAPFYTTPAREAIQNKSTFTKIETDNRNGLLSVELGRLLAEALIVIKELGLFNVEFLKILPVDKEVCDRSEIYKDLYEVTTLEFKSDKPYIPTKDGEYVCSSDSMLSGSSDLADLINKGQAKKLWGRSHWVDRRITSDKYKQLWDYLHYEIGVPSYDLANFASKVDKEFLVEQTDEWIVDFYKVIHKAPNLWRGNFGYYSSGVLRNKPIIRVDTDGKIDQVTPFRRDGKLNVFLPTESSTKYLTVKSNIASNEDARKFFEELGITKPDLFAEINELILPVLHKGEYYDGYFEDFGKLLTALLSRDEERKEQLIKDLQQCPFILSINKETGETGLLSLDNVYLYTENLEKYFDGSLMADFVDEDRYFLPESHRLILRDILKALGVINYPRKILIADTHLTDEDKRVLRTTKDLHDKTWDEVEDYTIDGLKLFFKSISLEKSVALWNILLSVPDDYFEGKYSWRNRGSYTREQTFIARFVEDLKKTPWLYDKLEKLVAPQDITYDELATNYDISDLNKRLFFIIGFKLNEVKLIEEKTGGILLVGKEKEEYEMYKLEKQRRDNKALEQDKKKLSSFNPIFSPEDVPLNSALITDFKKNKEYQIKQNDNTLTHVIEEHGSTVINSNKDNLSTTLTEQVSYEVLKNIGDWGQAFVKRALLKEYELDSSITILDFNDNGKLGVGCDFVVKSGEEVVRIVEVKSTTQSTEKTFSISGTQWEVARRYFNENDGDKFWIYCVFNAGQDNAKILKLNNPIKLWKEGNLFAHPIDFIINFD
ncbi:hypothetical protein GCM10023189_00990 [Nibrella saemangeumensis]|uniref:Protein NO VEIN C-terminal domain-containing protein n=1 Tax=Nibrella saemangeumensis TaxID=1084526 RepID=A0ABP8M8V1_9BACT